MTLVETYHAKHLERLARISAAARPEPHRACPKALVAAKPLSMPYDAGWSQMWFYDLLRPVRSVSEPPKIEEIQRAVIDHFKMTKIEFFSRRRTRKIVWPRQVAMYLCKTLTTRSLPEIGRKFGGKDHTTVLHAVRKVELHCAADEATRQEIAEIRRSIR